MELLTSLFPADVSQWLDTLGDIGMISGLILILIGGKLRWWVWGYQLAELRKDMEARLAEEVAEKKEWKELALRNLDVARTLSARQGP